jgi:hypothetical protein
VERQKNYTASWILITLQTYVHVTLKERGAETEVSIIHNGMGTGKD